MGACSSLNNNSPKHTGTLYKGSLSVPSSLPLPPSNIKGGGGNGINNNNNNDKLNNNNSPPPLHHGTPLAVIHSSTTHSLLNDTENSTISSLKPLRFIDENGPINDMSSNKSPHHHNNNSTNNNNIINNNNTNNNTTATTTTNNNNNNPNITSSTPPPPSYSSSCQSSSSPPPHPPPLADHDIQHGPSCISCPIQTMFFLLIERMRLLNF